MHAGDADDALVTRLFGFANLKGGFPKAGFDMEIHMLNIGTALKYTGAGYAALHLVSWTASCSDFFFLNALYYAN